MTSHLDHSLTMLVLGMVLGLHLARIINWAVDKIIERRSLRRGAGQ